MKYQPEFLCTNVCLLKRIPSLIYFTLNVKPHDSISIIDIIFQPRKSLKFSIIKCGFSSKLPFICGHSSIKVVGLTYSGFPPHQKLYIDKETLGLRNQWQRQFLQKIRSSPFWFIPIFTNKCHYIYVMDEASDFQFGRQLVFAKTHHRIRPSRKSRRGPGLGELLKIWGYPLIFLQRLKIAPFKFNIQLRFAKAHHKNHT